MILSENLILSEIKCVSCTQQTGNDYILYILKIIELLMNNFCKIEESHNKLFFINNNLK